MTMTLIYLMAIFQDKPGLPVPECFHLDFIGAKNGDNWSDKMYNAPVKSSPPKNQHLVTEHIHLYVPAVWDTSLSPF